MGGWNRSMGSSIDQDSINKLQEMGYNIDNINAQTIQEEINNTFGPNAVKTDNKWGNQSRAGLQALYERWKSLQPPTTETKTTIIQPSITQTPEFQEGLRQQFIKEETPEQQTDRAIANNIDKQLASRTDKNGTVYSNSHVRDLFDRVKVQPTFIYQPTNVSNASLGIKTPGFADWRTLINSKLSFKQGGQLVSKNPVQRFKQKNFRQVAQ